MANFTLLSLVVANSFTRSPFFQFSLSTQSATNLIKNVNTNYFFSSFLTLSGSATSQISDSKFNHYITSMPILSMGSLKTCSWRKNKNDPANDCVWYGDQLILKSDNKDDVSYVSNMFNYGNITKIKNCQFMSVQDDSQIQLSNNHGLCIYIKSNSESVVDQCYFFAIQSSRSGSCIFFDSNDHDAEENNVSNCIFKSVTQIGRQDSCEGFITGGLVSFGKADIERKGNGGESELTTALNMKSVAENCIIINCGLVPQDNIMNYQFGLFTFLSCHATGTNFNFTNNRVNRHGQLFGLITSFFQNGDLQHKFKFVNMFENTYSRYGLYSAYLAHNFDSLNLSYFNVMNNTAIDELAHSFFVNYYKEPIGDLPTVSISNIRSDSDEPFYNQLLEEREQNPPTIKEFNVNLVDSIFGGAFASEDSHVNIITNQNNQFNVKDVDPSIDLEKDKELPTFQSHLTHAFTNSDTFTHIYIVGSASVFDLKSNKYASFPGILATVFGILSLFAFIFLLYLRSGFRKKFHIIGFFEKRDSFDEIYHSEDGGYGNDASMDKVREHYHNDEDKDNSGLGEVENQTNDNLDDPAIGNPILQERMEQFSESD